MTTRYEICGGVRIVRNNRSPSHSTFAAEPTATLSEDVVASIAAVVTTALDLKESRRDRLVVLFMSSLRSWVWKADK